MAKERIKRQNFTKTKFNLTEVIIIMLITVICSITITIHVSFVINNTSKKIKTETELVEVINTYEDIVENYYKEVDKNELVDAAIEGMIDCLDDPYSDFYTFKEREEFDRELKGNYKGIGIEIVATNDKKITINKVFENGPSYKAGLKKGDVIIKINSKTVDGKTLTEVSEMINKSKQDKVNIEILRDKEKNIYTVNKGSVDIPSVEYKIIEMNGKKIAKIDISTFASNTYVQFEKKYKEIKTKNIDRIVLDLRGNTGGYLTTATSILEMFLNKNDIMYQLDTKGKITKVKNKKEQVIKEKIVVLINNSSASASEILTSALKENLSCDIVGVKTYGKGKVQKTKRLSNGSMVKYTIQNWLTSKGEEIDGKGIEPTIKVELDKNYYKNPIDANDNQLQKALSVIIKD